MSTLRNTGRRPVRGLHIARVVAAIGSAVAGLATACSDGPTAPAPTQAFKPGPHLSVAPAPQTEVTALTLPTSWPADSTVRFTVQPTGTVVRTPGGIATVSFPAGFVAQPTTFTITRKAGRYVGYDFQPSGTFNKPVTVTIAVGPSAARFASSLRGVYVRDWAQVDGATGQVRADEVVPTAVNANAGTVTLRLSHFSGYLVSSGRK